jgi:hypothetical protein
LVGAGPDEHDASVNAAAETTVSVSAKRFMLRRRPGSTDAHQLPQKRQRHDQRRMPMSPLVPFAPTDPGKVIVRRPLTAG